MAKLPVMATDQPWLPPWTLWYYFPGCSPIHVRPCTAHTAHLSLFSCESVVLRLSCLSLLKMFFFSFSFATFLSRRKLILYIAYWYIWMPSEVFCLIIELLNLLSLNIYIF